MDRLWSQNGYNFPYTRLIRDNRREYGKLWALSESYVVVAVVVFSQHFLLARAIRSARRWVFT